MTDLIAAVSIGDLPAALLFGAIIFGPVLWFIAEIIVRGGRRGSHAANDLIPRGSSALITRRSEPDPETDVLPAVTRPINRFRQGQR